MSILSTENVGHVFHDAWMFRNLSIGIHPYDRIALIGKNGVGKSTLLKLLAGVTPPKEGKVVRQSGISVGYLSQDPNIQSGMTIGDFVFRAENEEQKLLKEYSSLISQNNADPERVTILAQQLTERGAWEQEHQAKRVLHQLGIRDLTTKTENLSGGEKRRLALAELLIADPDILILDEPTNHLDIETTEWLEKFILTKRKTVFFVSHDRYFLDAICTSIHEITPSGYYYHQGNYNNFLEAKKSRIENESVLAAKQQHKYQKELEWMRRQPQARGTKSKSRQDKFYALKNRLAESPTDNPLQINFSSARQGKKILEINAISKTLGGKILFQGFSYVFKRGDRIGLAGKNGTGKTTFLNIISERTPPDEGRIEIGDTTRIGYYRQTGISLNGSKRVIEYITDIAECITMGDGTILSASQALNQFSFPPKKQHELVAKLSGGEKKRLQLLTVLFRNPNFLILDEPSNDLDLDTLNVLEKFLDQFPGVLILVSHDRYLLDTLTDQLFIFTPNERIKIYNGNYSDYKNSTQLIGAKQRTTKPRQQRPGIKKGRSYKEERELEQLEKEIEELETSIKDKSDQLSETVDHELLSEIGNEITLLNRTLNEKSERWLELSDK